MNAGISSLMIMFCMNWNKSMWTWSINTAITRRGRQFLCPQCMACILLCVHILYTPPQCKWWADLATPQEHTKTKRNKGLWANVMTHSKFCSSTSAIRSGECGHNTFIARIYSSIAYTHTETIKVCATLADTKPVDTGTNHDAPATHSNQTGLQSPYETIIKMQTKNPTDSLLYKNKNTANDWNYIKLICNSRHSTVIQFWAVGVWKKGSLLINMQICEDAFLINCIEKFPYLNSNFNRQDSGRLNTRSIQHL